MPADTYAVRSQRNCPSSPSQPQNCIHHGGNGKELEFC